MPRALSTVATTEATPKSSIGGVKLDESEDKKIDKRSELTDKTDNKKEEPRPWMEPPRKTPIGSIG